MEERKEQGWCCHATTCLGVGVPTVTLWGVELCAACEAKDKGAAEVAA